MIWRQKIKKKDQVTKSQVFWLITSIFLFYSLLWQEGEEKDKNKFSFFLKMAKIQVDGIRKPRKKKKALFSIAKLIYYLK